MEAPAAPRISDSGPILLCEAHFDVGTVFEGYGVDEAHLPLLERDDKRLRADAFAEKSHSAQKISVGYARAREDNLLSRRKVFGFIDALAVLYSHFCQTLLVLGLGHHQTRENLAVQAAQGTSGEYAFGCASGPHHRVYACSEHNPANACRQPAIPNQTYARPVR